MSKDRFAADALHKFMRVVFIVISGLPGEERFSRVLKLAS
jgi:hypothetical protein